MKNSFSEAYRQWRVEPFPKEEATTEFGDLHADLALIDTWVADSVVPYFDRHIYTPAKVDVLGKIASIESKLSQGSETGTFALKAQPYVKYLGLLRGVYGEFLQIGK